MDVAVVSGRQVLVDGELRPATLLVEDGRISEIRPYDADAGGWQAPETSYVLPGVVDTHVHVNEPGRTEWEGFVTATRAAALGGVTTLVDMPLNSLPPTTTVEALELKRAAATDELAIDVGFWGGAVPDNLGRLAPLWEAGVLGFKCFLAPSGVDEFPPLDAVQLKAALAEVAALDGLLIVHAEDAGELERAPHPPSPAYADFVLSRPDAAETEAIRQLVDGARETGCRVHVLHLASARALDLIKSARDEGLPLTVETCPHYLCFAAEQIPDASPQFKCCPPIRDEGNRAALWQGLTDGLIDAIVSDHSPATAEVKLAGGGDLQQAWGGVAGLQVGFTAVAHEARDRGIGIADVSRWMSRQTADLVGFTRKGRIEVGADADLAVYDPTTELVVDVDRLAHRNPISAYDGRTFRGSVTHTTSRGRLLDPDRPDHTWGRMLRREAP